MDELFTQLMTAAGMPVDTVVAPTPATSPNTITGQPETYQDTSARLKRMISDWKSTIDRAIKNRMQRDVDVNVHALRTEGKLDEDETLIPDRVIDLNITREQPPYINYLKNSRRLAIFTSQDNPNFDSGKLELEFTKGMTYLGWENDHYKVIDGSATHGWDTAEVVFDSSKPLHNGVEQVGYDKLFWPRSLRNIQQASDVIRSYDYSIIELQQFVKLYGWKANQIQKIVDARKDGKKESETVRVYKRMFKVDGVVNVAWFCVEDGCDDWLKDPAQLYLGIDKQDPMSGQWMPIPVNDYPYYILPYRESEKPKLIDKHGRCFLDGNKQEAQTAILSSFVNGIQRASKILGSPKQDDGTGNSVKEIANTPVEGGTIFSKPIDFFQAPYPDPMVLKALQFMDTTNAQETNQVNFAVMNREDSRKTAKEMSLAEQQTSLLNSVQLTLFSSYIRGIYTLSWKIVQSQAQQGLIKFLLINQPTQQINPVTQQPMTDPATGQPVMQDDWVNDLKSINQEFDIRAAGDVDVIQRAELINQMKQDWSVVSQTALAPQFLADLIMLSYPQKGEQYVKTLESANGNQTMQLQKLVAAMTTVLQAMVKQHPESVQELPPDQQVQLGQILNEGKQITATVQGGPTK